MATLTIRLSDEDRATLAASGKTRGLGVSSVVRELAEAEAQRLRLLEIADQVTRFMQSSGARDLDAATAPDAADWPRYGGQVPDRWLRESGLA